MTENIEHDFNNLEANIFKKKILEQQTKIQTLLNQNTENIPFKERFVSLEKAVVTLEKLNELSGAMQAHGIDIFQEEFITTNAVDNHCLSKERVQEAIADARKHWMIDKDDEFWNVFERQVGL